MHHTVQYHISKVNKMTYNFNPEQWLRNEINALEQMHRSGKLDNHEFAEALMRLEKSYDRMIERLDGTYQIPE